MCPAVIPAVPTAPWTRTRSVLAAAARPAVPAILAATASLALRALTRSAPTSTPGRAQARTSPPTTKRAGMTVPSPAASLGVISAASGQTGFGPVQACLGWVQLNLAVVPTTGVLIGEVRAPPSTRWTRLAPVETVSTPRAPWAAHQVRTAHLLVQPTPKPLRRMRLISGRMSPRSLLSSTSFLSSVSTNLAICGN